MGYSFELNESHRVLEIDSKSAKDKTIETPKRETIKMEFPCLNLLVAWLKEIKPIPTMVAPNNGKTGTNHAY
jgi:hypothetical protein